jgi:hypothetical protein
LHLWNLDAGEVTSSRLTGLGIPIAILGPLGKVSPVGPDQDLLSGRKSQRA